MATILHIGEQSYTLESFLSPKRTLITIGLQSDKAYNVIPLADEQADLFQCQLSQTPQGWKIQNGQWRTECPKGIRSRLQHACDLCIGCCVNPRPAHPTYSWRFPAKTTLLNGNRILEGGAILHPGDTISIENTDIQISSTC